MLNKSSCHVLLLLALLVFLLSGCAATTTALRHKDLEVQGQMSSSIFLDPGAKTQGPIYVQVGNTTGQLMDDFAPMLIELLHDKGYRVVDDPAKAELILQVNLLSVGEMSTSALEKHTGMGFGGAAVGATVGALVASSGHEWVGAGIGGLAMAVGEIITGTMVKAVEYGMISDVQLTLAHTGQVYQTRVGSHAVQVNLTFAEAYPALRDNQLGIISGLF